MLKDIISQINTKQKIGIIYHDTRHRSLAECMNKGCQFFSRLTNIVIIPNIGLYDEQNKQAMNECRDVIVDKIL